jgi:hypothetical protein
MNGSPVAQRRCQPLPVTNRIGTGVIAMGDRAASLVEGGAHLAGRSLAASVLVSAAVTSTVVQVVIDGLAAVGRLPMRMAGGRRAPADETPASARCVDLIDLTEPDQIDQALLEGLQAAVPVPTASDMSG